jgi:hypothetical protein
MSRNWFYIALLVSSLVAVYSFVSYMARARSSSGGVFESSSRPATSQRGYNTVRKTNLATIQAALERYRIDHDEYPMYLEELEGIYLVELPKDPATKSDYGYRFLDPQSYELSARMEDGSLFTVTSP